MCIGPTFLYLLSSEHLQPALSAFWRNQSILICLIPPLLIEKWYQPSSMPSHMTFEGRQYPLWALLSMNAFAWAFSLLLWIAALQYTTTSRASLFASIYPLIIILDEKRRGVRVSAGEFVGVFIALVGVICTELTSILTNEESNRLVVGDGDGGSSGSMLVGDVLCLISGIIYAADIRLSNVIRKEMNLFEYTTINTILSTLLVGVYSLAAEGATFSMDRQHGLFGWLSDSKLALLVSLFGLIVGLLGIVAFNLSIRYISPIIISTALLTDPGLTAIIAYIGQLEGIPPPSTFIGFAIVSLGIACTIIYQHKREKVEETKGSYQQVVEMSIEVDGASDSHTSLPSADVTSSPMPSPAASPSSIT